jgi:uncharacterized protein (DUF488 family)
MTAKAFFTIGHSTRSIDEFVDLLRAARVRLVIDIRSVARSRTNPQYNLDDLPGALSQYQIDHQRIAQLGGLRGKSKVVPPAMNGFWINQSFHNYADYAMSAEFHSGLSELLSLGHRTTCAIMCAEALWWRCHRRIVADYLIARGERVFHLMGHNRIDPAKLTDGVKILDDGTLVYPEQESQT